MTSVVLAEDATTVLYAGSSHRYNNVVKPLLAGKSRSCPYSPLPVRRGAVCEPLTRTPKRPTPPGAAPGRRLELFDAGDSPLDERGNRARRLVRGTWPGRDAGGSPRDERGTGPEVPGGSLAEVPGRQPGGHRLAEPDGTFLVTFYREPRGTTGEKVRISGTSSATHDVAFGQLPTSPWKPWPRQMAVVTYSLPPFLGLHWTLPMQTVVL